MAGARDRPFIRAPGSICPTGGRLLKPDSERHWTQPWTSKGNDHELAGKYLDCTTSNTYYVADGNEVRPLKKIGEGGQAVVFEAIWSNRKVAVKRFKPHNSRSQLWPDKDFKLESPYVCQRLVTLGLEDKSYAMVMELYSTDLRRSELLLRTKFVKPNAWRSSSCTLLQNCDDYPSISWMMCILHSHSSRVISSEFLEYCSLYGFIADFWTALADTSVA